MFKARRPVTDRALIVVLGVLVVCLGIGWSASSAQWRTIQRQYHATLAGNAREGGDAPPDDDDGEPW